MNLTFVNIDVNNTFTGIYIYLSMSLNVDEYSTSKTIELGVWNSNYDECRYKADNEHIPIVFYWTSNPNSCHFCEIFETNCLRSNEFKTWQKSKPYIFCYTEGKKHPIFEGAFNSIISNRFLTGFPFIWLHWKINDALTIDERFTGRAMSLPIKGKIKNFMPSVDQFFQYYTK